MNIKFLNFRYLASMLIFTKNHLVPPLGARGLLFFLVFISIISCTDDEVIVPLGAYENGYFVSNEGNYGTDNAEVTFISYDGQTVKQDVFKSENNGAILGNTLQSIAFFQDNAFLVLNGSNKIEVVNRYTFKRIATINTGLNNPRYMAFANGKGYVTNWGAGSNPNDDFVAVINLSTYIVQSTIGVVEGPEKIIAHNNILYVAHQGGYNFNNKISIINSNNVVSQTLTVGDVPVELSIVNNQLHVFCSGKTLYDSTWTVIIEQTAGVFKSFNLSNYTETQSVSFIGAQQPRQIKAYQNKVYYVLNDQIFVKDISSTTLPTNALFNPTVTAFYGINISNDKIYICDAKTFNVDGSVKIFNLVGNLQNEYPTRIGPNGVVFN